MADKMKMINMFVMFILFPQVKSSSSSSRPVRSDSEVFRALEWTVHEPEYFYGNTSGKPEKDSLKYHSRKEIEEHEVDVKGDAETTKLSNVGNGNSQCPVELELLWSTKLGSSIYSTPITRRSMFGDGGVQIVASTFVRYLELIEGADGLAPTGWPLAFDIEDRQSSHDQNSNNKDDDFLYDDDDQIEEEEEGLNRQDKKSKKSKSDKRRNHGYHERKGPSIFHGSPAIHDINGDGIDDILIADGDGNLYWVAVGNYGQYLHDYRITVPKLRIRKDWYEGLDLDYTDRYVDLSMFHHHGSNQDDDIPIERIGEDLYGGGIDDVMINKNNGQQLKRGVEAETLSGHSIGRRFDNKHKNGKTVIFDTPLTNKRNLLSIEEEVEGEEVEGDGGEGIDFGDGGNIYDDLYENYGLKGGRSFDDHYGSGGYGHDDEYGGGGRRGVGGGQYNESEWVFIDAHILGTPTVADIDGDGHVEILVSVSYFFDSVNGNSASKDINPRKYVAGGVVCYDLQAQDWVWKVHLDLTTDEGKYKAYVFAAPSVGDLDGDGSSEVVVGTGLGLLYALDAASGFVLKGFPIQMGEIQAQVALGDVVVNDGTGDLEILVGDMLGNLLCINRDGEVLWDRQFPGSCSSTPTIGDIDGDGFLDIAIMITTKSGGALLYAIKGENGDDLPNFPIRLLSKNQKNGIIPSVLLVDLHGQSAGLTDSNNILNDKNNKIIDFIKESKELYSLNIHQKELMNKKNILDKSNRDKDKNKEKEENPEPQNIKLRGGFGLESGPAPLGGWNNGLHLVVPTSDGKLHIVEGGSGCLNHIDIGEHMYSMTLAEDVQGDGLLDLVVSTMNGELMALGTSVPYHPLNAWGSMPNQGGRNGFTHAKHFGVFLYDMGGLRESGGGGEGGGDSSSDVLEVSGRFITVTFEIVDKRILFPPPLEENTKKKDKNQQGEQEGDYIGDDDVMLRYSHRQSSKTQYTVSLSLGSNSIDPLYKSTFSQPGIYSIELELDKPMLTVIHLLVVNEHGQSTTTNFTVSYNMNAFNIMKYLIVIPFLLSSIPLILFPNKRWKMKTSDLPN